MRNAVEGSTLIKSKMLRNEYQRSSERAQLGSGGTDESEKQWAQDGALRNTGWKSLSMGDNQTTNLDSWVEKREVRAIEVDQTWTWELFGQQVSIGDGAEQFFLLLLLMVFLVPEVLGT